MKTLMPVFPLLLALVQFAFAADGLPNRFYAMDTAFQRPGLDLDQQLALVKELGYAGVAWHEQAPEQAKASVEQVEKHGLKMFTIYCAGTVTPEGKVSYSPNLPKLMEVLKGHDTIIWFHIGGKGPDISTLDSSHPVIKNLRDLADLAAKNDTRIAVYPHVGEWTAKFGDATKLAQLVNHKAFGVTFNLCHALAMGEEKEIPQLLEQAAPVLVTVTVSGADADVSGAKWDRLIQTLDKGTYDVGIVLRQLKKIGFTGPIGFQGYAIKGDARSILAPTMQAWKKLSATAAGSK